MLGSVGSLGRWPPSTGYHTVPVLRNLARGLSNTGGGASQRKSTKHQYALHQRDEQRCRFHKTTRQWFRRHEDGQAYTRTEAHEEGTYIYFDAQLANRDDSWVFRLKSNYRLPFAQLENELAPL